MLLTYGWVRSSYAALRNLTAHGLRVVIGDTCKIGMCQFSRWKSASLNYQNPFKNERDFLDTLTTYISKNKVKVLLPSHDETVVIAKNRHLFPPTCEIPLAPVDLLELANNKSKSQKFAYKHRLPTAERIQYHSLSELQESLFKGNYGRLVIRLQKSNSAKGVFYANDNADCIEIIEMLIKKHGLDDTRLPVVQKFVQGEGWGVSCLYWNGERIAHFTHRRLREKTETGGTSTLREHQPNEYLEEMAFVLLDKLNWHGLAMVEFKFDPETRNGWFIEINPRLWGSIHLAISAGVEFPWLLYLCATEGADVAKRYHESKIIKYPWRSRWYLGDCIVALSNMRKCRIKSTVETLLPGNTDAYDDLHIDDPSSFFGEACYYLYNFIKYRSINPISESMIG